MQTIRTKHYGEIVFKKTWRTQHNNIGLRANGEYCHFNGLPITNSDIIRETIANPDDLALALEWFDYYSNPEKAPAKVRKIYYEIDDKTYRYMDTHQVVDTLVSLQAALRDEALESALLWFSRYYRKSRIAEREGQAPVIKGLDEQIIDLLAVEPGLTSQAIQKTLDSGARDTLESIQLLVNRGDVVMQGKVYYLASHIEITV